jgi:hypothetical protein
MSTQTYQEAMNADSKVQNKNHLLMVKNIKHMPNTPKNLAI